MAFLIDTSVFVNLERTGGKLSDAFRALTGDSVCISAITASELLHGVYRAQSRRQRDPRQRFVETILRVIPVVPFNLTVSRAHARLGAELVRNGQIMGSHDLIIAATALSYDMTVVSQDSRGFKRISELSLRLWSSPS